jgi:hypothetical protein
MKTEEIIAEIQKLPLNKKLYLTERTMHLIRKQELKDQLTLAAESLLQDYSSDKELIAFTNLDF